MRAVWNGTVLAEADDTVVGGEANPDVAWYYPQPEAAARNIAGRVAFWHGVRAEGGDTDTARPATGRFARWRRALAG